MQADIPTFAIIVTEKGGNERREIYQASELSIGRVHGNELALPKGNVSKRHARLIYRDGRFIITDLGSTNGTYVNRRRISQATIVKEGDRIYIGDFVLRLEAATEEDTESMRDKRSREASQHSTAQSGRPSFSLRASGSAAGRPEEPPPGGSGHEFVAVPPVNLGEVSGGATLQPSSNGAAEFFERGEQQQGSTPDGGAEAVKAGRAWATQGGSAHAHTARREDAEALSADQSALRLLVSRVYESLAPGALDKDMDERLAARFLAILQEQYDDLVQDGELPSGVSGERLLADARAELLELGPVTRLLADPRVTAVRVLRFDQISVGFDEDHVERSSLAFTSEAALLRAIVRLCQKAGVPLMPGEQIVRRRLPDGVEASAVLGEAAPRGPALSLRRPRASRWTFADLIEAERLSAAMAKFLEQTVASGLRVLVAGPPSSTTSALMSALSRLGPSGESVAVIQGGDEWIQGHPSAVTLQVDPHGSSFTDLLEVARSLAGRVFVDLAEMERALDIVFACDPRPLVGYMPASSAQGAIERLVCLAAARCPGLPQATAASLVAGSFDILVEILPLTDSGARVTRIAEVAGASGDGVALGDVFFFEPSTSSGAAPATGYFRAAPKTPLIAAAMARRGVELDAQAFRQ